MHRFFTRHAKLSCKKRNIGSIEEVMPLKSRDFAFLGISFMFGNASVHFHNASSVSS